MSELRPYQVDCANKAFSILSRKMIVYLSMEVRCGKTATSLETAKLYRSKNVLFLTKKKAINSILDDYHSFGYDKFFEITVINDESMHTVTGDYDLVIHDEHHRFGSFPKPGKTAKLFKERFMKKPIIFLSGTPTPESYSQIFHQFWVSLYNPFGQVGFYNWAKIYVTIKQRNVGYGLVNDYSEAKKESIDKVISEYMVSFTQKDAGFTTNVNEHILHVPMKEMTYELCNRLKKELCIIGQTETITADTGAKLMQKLHQLFSGTIKFDSGNKKVLDFSKAEFIKQYFQGKKIAIFYKFTQELEALKVIFGDQITTSLDEFNETDKNFAIQIVTGREGISLRQADYLIYYNFDFSATSYWQSRDRLTTMERKTNDVYFIFSKGGIEDKIYKSVMQKKSYTLSHFKKDYEFKIPSKN